MAATALYFFFNFLHYSGYFKIHVLLVKDFIILDKDGSAAEFQTHN